MSRLRSSGSFIATFALLLVWLATPAAAVGGSKEAEQERERQQRVTFAREKAAANRTAEMLIQEEETRRRRTERETARAVASRSRTVPPVQAEAAADAGLAALFAADARMPQRSEPRSYPSAIVVDPMRENPGSQTTQTRQPETVMHESLAPGSSGMELFHTGYSRYSQGDFLRARAAFAQFLQDHPGHELADSAQYWIGECTYAQGDYAGALVEYRKVLDSFPFGDKVPDALLKTGYSLLELGRTAEGREVLGRLVAEFPDTGAARRAGERLASLGLDFSAVQ